jgi:hypothetical protein
MILERLQGVPAAFLYFVFREGKKDLLYPCVSHYDDFLYGIPHFDP